MLSNNQEKIVSHIERRSKNTQRIKKEREKIP